MQSDLNRDLSMTTPYSLGPQSLYGPTKSSQVYVNLSHVSYTDSELQAQPKIRPTHMHHSTMDNNWN
jgi:hypothetical protein